MRRTLTLASAACFLACTGTPRGPGGTPDTAVTTQPNEQVDPDTERLDGLRFALSEVERPGQEAGERIPTAQVDTLDARTTDRLLERLPEMEATETADFALREGSPPPPLTGEDIQQPWPPPPRPDAAPDTEPGPLAVQRFAPEGEVPLAPHVSVTFNQPMIAVTSQDQASQTVPVTLDPEPAGAWRWLGTKTVLFDPDPRLPMATTYTVTVPADTTSALDGRLDDEVTFSFATPAPTVQEVWPRGDARPLEPVVVVGFDQAIDAQMRSFVRLDGGQDPTLRPATAAELEADPAARAVAERFPEDRRLVLTPEAPLRRATAYELIVDKGAPSAEGPRTTDAAQSRGFRTFDPLKIERWDCWDTNDGCNPDGALQVDLTNIIDPDSVADNVVVEPKLLGQQIEARGSGIRISGVLPGRSKVRVTLRTGLTDIFGQTLGQDRSNTFSIGPASDLLTGPDRQQVVLDPTGPATFSVYSRNHDALKLRVYRMTPEDLPDLRRWYSDARREDFDSAPPLQELDRRTLQVDGADDTLVETPIDLSGYLDNDLGHLFLWVEPPTQPKQSWRQTHVMAWVQRTRIGLTALHDGDELLVWATDLATGAPMEDVVVQLQGGSQSAPPITDAEGLVRFDAPARQTERDHVLVAMNGDDVSALPSRRGLWGTDSGWVRKTPETALRVMTFDDRGMYKPGESIRVKAIARPFTASPEGGVGVFDGQGVRLDWTATDSRGADLGQGTVDVSELGTFDLALDLPASPNLGMARITFRGIHQGKRVRHTHRFQIQEFRRPEYEVRTTVDPRPYILGEHALATVEAAYYSGEPLPGAETAWRVTATPGRYRPPGHDGYSFGPWTPWWRSFGGETRSRTTQTLRGKTGADGTHTTRMDFLAMNPPRPMQIQAEATVFDVNRQRWSSSTGFVLHPADRYVGLHADTPFADKGEDINIDVIATDIDGAIQEGTDVTVRIARMTWKRSGSTWDQVAIDPTDCDVTTTAPDADPARCTATPDVPGRYRIRAEVTDTEGRTNRTDTFVWVGGGESKPERAVTQQQVTLVPGAKTFAVGETAEILVQAPFEGAEGLVTLRRDGLLETRRISLEGGSTTLQLPVEASWVPNVHLEVDLVGSAVRLDDNGDPLSDQPRRVAYASGALDLSVPPVAQTLDVALDASEALAPGEDTSIDITVTDADGQPVNGAEIALWMVDEAVLALSGYETPDPLSIFYAARSAGVSEAHLRSRVVLVDPASLAPDTGAAAMGDGEGARAMSEDAAFGASGAGAPRRARMKKERTTGAAPPAPSSAAPMSVQLEAEEVSMEAPGGAAASDAPIDLRSDFRALAVFAPAVRTDTRGRATVEVDLPDSLTRYRVMAVAMDPEVAFGSGEANVTVRKPLMLRPSPPRFLNVGDRAELPFVVQNPTEAAITVDLAVRVANARVLDEVSQDVLTAPDRDRAGLRFMVPAENRREVRVPVGVIDAGRFRFQAVIAGSDAADAATDDLPVWTPATTEAFATYGTFEDGAMQQPVDAPDDAWPQYGGLEVTTSSTQLQALTDALLYLNGYPFACTEQLASRVLANAALRDVLEAFQAEQLPPPADLEASVEADLKTLAGRQTRNGGFSYWGRSLDLPHASLHALHAFLRAKDKGFDVDQAVIDRGLQYARRIERHLPDWYSDRAHRSIRAYALFVRHRAGDSDLGEARTLYREGLDALPLEAQAWILPVLHAGGATDEVSAIRRNLGNKVTETAASATFTEAYTDTSDYVLMHSSRRTDAVILESLLEVAPEDELVVKVVRGLLGHRTRGRWSTTQENSFVLLAMDRYFRAYEGVTPDFVARMWIDEGFAGEVAFRGRTTERQHLDVPMAWLLEKDGPRDLTLAKDGPGRLYYRVGLNYAPRDLQLDPADHGFSVQRTYEAIEDDGDVTRDPDGTWRITAGARVRIRVEMVAPSRRTLVALIDPLPAGLEPMNPALAVTGQIPDDPNVSNADRYWWWSRPWYNHQNLRDDRAEAFAQVLWAGVHEYTYVATATTPGRYVVPPPRAEEMYHPETFGRGASDKVIVEE